IQKRSHRESEGPCLPLERTRATGAYVATLKLRARGRPVNGKSMEISWPAHPRKPRVPGRNPPGRQHQPPPLTRHPSSRNQTPVPAIVYLSGTDARKLVRSAPMPQLSLHSAPFHHIPREHEREAARKAHSQDHRKGREVHLASAPRARLRPHASEPERRLRVHRARETLRRDEASRVLGKVPGGRVGSSRGPGEASRLPGA